MLEALSKQYGLHMLAHRGDPLSPIAALTTTDAETVAELRGEIYFAAAEEILTRLAPLVRDTGCLVLDFTAVTRVGGAAGQVLRSVPDAAGTGTDGKPLVVVRDPEGVLGSD